MNIADILRHKGPDGTQVATIAPGDSVATLLRTLAEHNVGALVVTDGPAVVGMVSERDVVRRVASDGAAVLDGPVHAIMTTDLVTCASTDSIDAIAQTMTDRRVRHMPVLDDGALAGIVSIGDVVRSRISQLEQDRGQLEQYIAR